MPQKYTSVQSIRGYKLKTAKELPIFRTLKTTARLWKKGLTFKLKHPSYYLGLRSTSRLKETEWLQEYQGKCRFQNFQEIRHSIHVVQSSDSNSLNNHCKRSDALKKSIKHFSVRLEWNDSYATRHWKFPYLIFLLLSRNAAHRRFNTCNLFFLHMQTKGGHKH